MERIGTAGWFLSNEEYEKLSQAIDTIKALVDSVKAIRARDGRDLTLNDPGKVVIEEIEDPGFNKQAQMQPDCSRCPWSPWSLNPKPYINPCDWTWRPWQAPWYGEEYKVGDGEWWKHQPYCTSTTDDNPNAVKESKSNIDPHLIERLRNVAEKYPNPTKE